MGKPSTTGPAKRLLETIWKSISNRQFVIVLVAVAIIVSYLELPPTFLPLGGDNVIPAFNGAEFGRYLSVWNQWNEVGSNVPQVLAGPPLTDAAFLTFAHLIGFGEVQASWLYFGLFNAIGALGTAYLFRIVFPRIRSNIMASILSGLFFLLNPSLVVDTFKGLWLALPERAFFPIFLALFLDGHQKQKMERAILCGLVSFILLARFPVSSAQYLVATISFVGCYLTIAIGLAKPRSESLRFSLRYAGLVTLTTLAVNAYIIWPFLLNLPSYTATLSSFSTSRFNYNAWSGIFNSIRLLSFWGFYNGYVPYATTYSSDIIVVVATLVIPCLSFGAVVMIRSKRAITVGAFALGLVFLAKGNNDLFGQWFSALTSVSILKAFYISSTFIPFLAVAYSLLLPAMFAKLTSIGEQIIRNRKFLVRAAMAVGIIAVIVTASWPLVTGSVGSDFQQPSQRGVNIPPAYGSLREILDTKDPSQRTLLAYNPTIYVSTSWGFTGSEQFYQNYFVNPVVTGIGTQYGQTDALVSYAYQLQHFTSLDLSKTITLTNATRQVWRSYQFDNVSLVSSAFNNSAAFSWLVQSNLTSIHQISYALASPENWSTSDILSLWLGPETNLTDLRIGIMDSGGSVGWYYPASHTSRTSSGWTEVILPLKHPDYSHFNPTIVSSLWAQTTASGTPVEIQFSSFQYGSATYDSGTWAKLLAILGIRWILRDDSLTVGNWSDYDILESPQIFVPVFSQDFLTLYENQVTAPVIHSVQSVVAIDSMLALRDIISSQTFDPNSSSFSTNMNIPAASPARVTIVQTSPTLYSVLASANGPYLLVFDQEFDSRWILTDLSGTTYDHFELNGFANAWSIPKGGDMKFTLEYSPQFSFSLFFALSMGYLVGIPILLVAWRAFLYGKRNDFKSRFWARIRHRTPLRSD